MLFRSELDADGIHERVRILLATKSSVRGVIAGGSDARTTVAVVTGDEGADIQLIDIVDGAPPAPARKVAAPGVRGGAWTAGGKSLVLVAGAGSIGVIVAGTDQVRPVAFRAKATWDRAALQLAIYDEAWQALNDGFYDPEFHGADWKALHSKYQIGRAHV